MSEKKLKLQMKNDIEMSCSVSDQQLIFHLSLLHPTTDMTAIALLNSHAQQLRHQQRVMK